MAFGPMFVSIVGLFGSGSMLFLNVSTVGFDLISLILAKYDTKNRMYECATFDKNTVDQVGLSLATLCSSNGEYI